MIDDTAAGFYETFWSLIKILLYKFFDESIQTEGLSVSLSVITLVRKHNKDKTKLGNWRPISLINVDIKCS